MNKLLLICALIGHPMIHAQDTQEAVITESLVPTHTGEELAVLQASTEAGQLPCGKEELNSAQKTPLLRSAPPLVQVPVVTGQPSQEKRSAPRAHDKQNEKKSSDKQYLEQALAHAQSEQALHRSMIHDLKQRYALENGENNSPKLESVLELYLAAMCFQHFAESRYMPSNSKLKAIVQRLQTFLYLAIAPIALRAVYNLVWNLVVDGGQQTALANEESDLEFLAHYIEKTKDMELETNA